MTWDEVKTLTWDEISFFKYCDISADTFDLVQRKWNGTINFPSDVEDKPKTYEHSTHSFLILLILIHIHLQKKCCLFHLLRDLILLIVRKSQTA